MKLGRSLFCIDVSLMRYFIFILYFRFSRSRCVATHQLYTLLQYKKLSIGAWLSVVDCRLMAKSETLNFNIFKTLQWIVLKFHRAMFLTMLISILSSMNL